MGAKQSKRSVDISGKEAEGAGEVAAAGACGEGRVEQLADADALKPQLNGDAHIHEQTEKQKDLDSSTPENEKDATTEKEAKLHEEEKEAVSITNGESEQKVEHVESTPTPEDGKKPKKEKVKKKWSLRSISFSRKDKPKQEKKQKDEEPKTNGEPEKLQEETAEVATEPAVTESAEEAKTESDIKEEKTPETPVTEPITYGSTTPESPKDESPVTEEPAAPSTNNDRPEPQPETQPEQLPVNGLSLEETAKENPSIEKHEECKEESTADTTEIVPEISVKKEVCVEQMPLIESTPPPLPANPPPSSVASFAATTMAPESTDASLANTADNAIPPKTFDPIAKDKLNELSPMSENELTNTQAVSNELPPPLKEVSEEISVSIVQTEAENQTKKSLDNAVPLEDNNVSSEAANINTESVTIKKSLIVMKKEVENQEIIENTDMEILAPPSEVLEMPANKIQNAVENLPSPPSPICGDVDVIDTKNNIAEENIDNTQVTIHETKEVVVNSNHIFDTEKTVTENEMLTDSKDGEQNVKAKSKDSLGNLNGTIECNGNIEEEKLTKENEMAEMIPPINHREIKNIESGRMATTPDDSMPPSLSEANESVPAASVNSNDESESFPLPPSELCRSESEPSPAVSPEPASDAPADTPQESTPVSDKLAELIPEVPNVPELKTETLQETTSDVAVAN